VYLCGQEREEAALGPFPCEDSVGLERPISIKRDGITNDEWKRLYRKAKPKRAYISNLN